MNMRDKLYVQRELIAWSAWIRDGRTYPNALGFKSVAAGFGTIGMGTVSGCSSGARVPSRFNDDRNVATIDRVFWKMPVKPREAVSGVYIYRFNQQRVGDILGISRMQVNRRLNDAYEIIFSALSG